MIVGISHSQKSLITAINKYYMKSFEVRNQKEIYAEVETEPEYEKFIGRNKKT